MNDMSNPPRATAKLFWSGRSQAVRLPKEFRFEGKEVRIWREDGKVILEADDENDLDWAERLAGSMDDDCAEAILEDRPEPETLPEWAHLK